MFLDPVKMNTDWRETQMNTQSRWTRKYHVITKEPAYFGLYIYPENNRIVELRKKFGNAKDAMLYAKVVNLRYERLKIARELVAARPKRGRPKKTKVEDADTPESDS